MSQISTTVDQKISEAVMYLEKKNSSPTLENINEALEVLENPIHEPLKDPMNSKATKPDSKVSEVKTKGSVKTSSPVIKKKKETTRKENQKLT